ncbi:MAG TPA: hypothetical protein VHN13_00770 [Candidatus Tectomicrobia bacterium]|jgi:hypothetical protein|nr:hypothetical protein [Candidatus Tectomicrobia bacterium]
MPSLPPGPRSATLQTLAFARDPFGTLQHHARRYGDPFPLGLFGRQRLATAGAHTPAMPRAAPLVWPARLRGGGARRQRLGPSTSIEKELRNMWKSGYMPL